MKVTPELLKRYHLGQCSEEERAAVTSWLEDGHISTGDEAPEATDTQATDTEEVTATEMAASRARIWASLQEQVTEEDIPNAEPEAEQPRRLWKQWLPYAAAAILLISLTTAGLLRYTTGTPAGSKVAIRHSHVPYGEKKMLILADGTKVYLNAGAELSYPPSFTGDYREVSLLGEAYFEVAPDKKKPFIISTAYDTRVKVVGTAFNIRAEPHSPQVEVAVSEGTVHFMKATDRNGFVELKAGQFAVYNDQTGTFAEGNALASNIGLWREHKLVFDSDPLEEAFRKIERWYGYKIDVRKETLLKQRYSAQYASPKLEDVLDNMAFVLNFKYTINKEDNMIEIR